MSPLPSFKKMVIVGVGLIGGSLALACRNKDIVSEIVGVGRSKENLQQALSMNVIDTYFFRVEEAVKDADLIVLATPVKALIRLTEEMVPYLSPGTILTDVGSVKGAVMSIEDIVPPNSSFVGGHPIAGREKSGVRAASPDLFINARCILTPTQKTNTTALERVRSLWEIVGANVSYMSPSLHDKIFAAVSHLPHVAAYALVNTLIDLEETEKDIISFSAGGFKDFTRIAASHPEMWRDICLMNKENIIEMLEAYEEYIGKLKRLIKEEKEEELYSEFVKAKTAREKIQDKR